MERRDSPDSDVGYIEEDHPLRPQLAAQSIALLQVPPGQRSRHASVSSNLTDQDVPIYVRQKPNYTQPKGLNPRLAFAIAAAAVGSAFQHGYNLGVVNAPQKLIEEWILGVIRNQTDASPPSDADQTKVTMIFSIAVSIYCVGGMLGGAITGLVAEKYGRKGGLLFNNIFIVIAAALLGFSKAMNSYYMIIVGRFLLGINSGLNAGLTPMYLSEIAPVQLRGAVGTVYQLVLTISILISQILGLNFILGTAELWPILLSLTIVPTIFQLITLPMCPESPKYLLITKGQEIESQRAVTWFRGTIEVHDEMDEMRREYESMKLVPKVTLREMLVNSALRIPLFISLVVMIAQQLSGINAVIFFSTSIFQLASLGDSAQLATLAMGAMNVLMTVISLVLVERVGRKVLLLVGFSGMFVITCLLAVALAYVKSNKWLPYVCILLVIAFVVMFAVGPGSIPWFLVSELFNQSALPLATSLAVGTNWTANFFVGLGFLPLQQLLGGHVFFIFAILQALFIVFIYKKVPETKNKTLEEISTMFKQISYT
ncbi:solute carrier family 2, facilitated glucose transporter member 1 isoform X1 [Nilaparvata lugens]|uniref:solute carrier family 2, facilitated glucose transporter member 1 isoform X1 n=1 Tax=Nilaparvata lugens TaxID=108931 RepID=UPI00193E8B82|nr:solute carrier family 2, facilitated glucose transporter member 1 isoform X1 [Nilaparvata lugens]XP_039279601.1 solute carrier family 2, facilitated glucose transporter member 1 isoform X1 [Nilaparvata lugens]